MIVNLQDDLEDVLELDMLEKNIVGLKEKTSCMISILEGKISTEKEEFVKILRWIIFASSNFLQLHRYFNLNCITSDNIIYGLGGK